MTTEINLGNLVIPIIKPQKGTDYYTEAEKQELISIVTNNVNSVIMPQEQTRQENEATRQSNEETRQSQENTRQSNEVSRQTAESARVEAENLRQSNETSRISAEQTRVETFNTQMQAVDTAIGGIHTSQDAYDQNAQAKTEAFNTNATNKINVYNENASEKIDEYDQHVHDYETELANKVDKVPGKDLSTNDYDNTEKGKVQANTEARHTHSNKSVLDGTTASYTTEKDQKLDGLENYDDTELREDIEQNRTSIEENYKEITKLQEDVEDLTERVEDAENNEMTYTPEVATSHYLQDSADSRFRKFIPIGRTTQESTTGKNKLPITLDLLKTMNSGTNWQGNVCTRNGITYTVNDDLSITIGGVYSERSFFYLMRPSTNIIFPSERYRITGCPTGGSADSYRLSMAYYDDSTYVSEVNETGSGNLLDLTSIATPKLQAIIEIKNSSAIGKTFYPMFRLATETDDTYEPYTGGEPAPNPNYPYAIKNTGDNGSVNEKVSNSDGTQEQNISFPLAQGQKLMKGDYLADDGIHHKRGEIVLDGTVGGYNADYNWFYLSFTNLQIQKPKTLNILSNYFKYYNRNEFATDTSLNGISFNAADISTASTFVIRNTNCTNATEYKNWLAEVLPKVIYELAEEQTEDFTSEQKTAWEEIKKARTYKNVTHISSEDETPANVEIEYVQDTKTYIDNQIEPLKSAIISLGGNV